MPRYLLDTSVLIDYSLGREPVRTRLMDLLEGPHEVAIGPIQIAEFISGIAPSERSSWQGFLETITFWQPTRTTGYLAGAYRYDFARRGISLAAPDVLIAALAYERAAIVLTNNARHFPMSDIEVIVLRTDAPKP